MMARILAHQRDLGNGVGLHYSGFHRFSAVPAPSNQLLASIPPRKNRYYCQPIREDGLSFLQRGRHDYTPQVGSDRTLTLIMGGKKALNLPRGLEPLHDPLASSGRLM